MKTTLFTFLLAFLCLCGSVEQLQAQGQGNTPAVTYVSRANGSWTSAATWTVIKPNRVTNVSLFPARNANNIVIISHDVRLGMDYDVGGNDGLLTITEDGALSHTGQFTLTVGDQQGSAKDRIIVEPRTGLAMNMYKLDFIKAEGSIEAPIKTASCLIINNQTSLSVPSTITVNGNLVINQGNTDARNRGTIIVKGVIDGNRNALRNYNSVNIIVLNDPTVSANCNTLVPLPVELSSFTAAYDNNQVNLRWITASEKNSADFTVERSFDGETFSGVAKVAAAGNSSARREYAATDLDMRKGLNYYRLKQTDLDGTFSYTQVIPVQVGSVKQHLQAYGDNGNLNIVLQTEAALQTLRVLDNMGRVVYTENLTSPTTGLVTRQIPVTGTNNRQMYIVQAVTSEGVLNGKFMIAK